MSKDTILTLVLNNILSMIVNIAIKAFIHVLTEKKVLIVKPMKNVRAMTKIIRLDQFFKIQDDALISKMTCRVLKFYLTS